MYSVQRQMYKFSRNIYIYVWKLNQTVLELDFRAVKFLFFPRRDLNPHHWYTAAPFVYPYVQRPRPLDHIHSLYIVSRVRALSPAWTGSHARETLISRTHLFLPPTKKSSTIKSWPTFCDQYSWKFPIWNSCADEKRREIRMVKVFKWYPVINLFDTFTGKLGHGD